MRFIFVFVFVLMNTNIFIMQITKLLLLDTINL